MSDAQRKEVLNSGSYWHRWEPHIHAPETLLNNQFKGKNVWEDYLTALELSNPPIRTLAVTDYYLTGTYTRVLGFACVPHHFILR